MDKLARLFITLIFSFSTLLFIQSGYVLAQAGDPCTGSGCGGHGSSCAPGYACPTSTHKCSWSPFNCDPDAGIRGGGSTQDDSDREVVSDGISCTNNGACDYASCGDGYICRNGFCESNDACLGQVIEVPYDGPQINSFGELVARFYNIMFPTALAIGVLMIIKGGYEIATSEGNPQKAREGQEDLTAAVLGTAFVILSAVILRIVIVQILGGSVAF